MSEQIIDMLVAVQRGYVPAQQLAAAQADNEQLRADLARQTERADAAEQQRDAALDPERIAGDIASSLGDAEYQPNQCAQEHPDGMCINVNDLMATIQNRIEAALAAAAPSAEAREPRGEGV